MTRIIALSGYAQSGKDTVAKCLREDGWERIAFADALREAVYTLNPIVFQTPGLGTVRIQDIVDNKSWDYAKTTEPEVRRLLQAMGTEVGRALLGDDVWVEIALRKITEGGKYVITDCRFPNEAAAVRRLGGEVWRIQRPGYEPVNAHPSETALDGYEFDTVISNHRTIHELSDLVRSLT